MHTITLLHVHVWILYILNMYTMRVGIDNSCYKVTTGENLIWVNFNMVKKHDRHIFYIIVIYPSIVASIMIGIEIATELQKQLYGGRTNHILRSWVLVCTYHPWYTHINKFSFCWKYKNWCTRWTLATWQMHEKIDGKAPTTNVLEMPIFIVISYKQSFFV